MNKKKPTATVKKIVKEPVKETVKQPAVVETVQKTYALDKKIYILAGIFFASAIVAGSVTHVTFDQMSAHKPGVKKTEMVKIKGGDILKSPMIDPYELVTADRSLATQYELVDLRDNSSYVKGHIKKSVNVPFHDQSVDLSLIQKSKHIILYSYTDYSSDTQNVMTLLQKEGYHVSILKTGWNTFRHFSNLWIPESAWGTIRVDDFVESDTN